MWISINFTFFDTSKQETPKQEEAIKMASLQVRTADRQSLREKEKAIEDAKQMQQMVVEAANRANKDPPKYVLVQLIGRGSFGRVYKA